MTIAIRTMTRDDIEPVSVLLEGLDRLHREHVPWLFQVPAEAPRGRDFFMAKLESDEEAIFVAETDAIVGALHVMLQRPPDFPVFIPQLRGLVDSIFIAPAYRRTGAATLLMQAAEAWAKDQGAVGMNLSVYDFNDSAQELFSTLGYAPLHIRMVKHFD